MSHMDPPKTHWISAAQRSLQTAHAERVSALYREKLMAKGFRFGTTISDHDSVFPPKGMAHDEARKISNQIWNEVNDLSIDQNFHS